MKLISIIMPCYNEEDNIADFYDEVMKNTSFFVEKELTAEFLYANDGSMDNTVNEIKKLKALHDHVRLVSFSCSFGKEAGFPILSRDMIPSQREE